MKNLIHHRDTCRACYSENIELVFQLKPSPIGDAYITAEELDNKQSSYPIDLHICRNCKLAQIVDIINPSILYGNYIYLTKSSTGLKEHFKNYAKNVSNRCVHTRGSLVVDVGSNDGTLLKYFKNFGYEVLGIEPAAHIAEDAIKDGINTIASFLDVKLANKIVREYGKAKLITSNNVFANIDDINTWIEAIDILMDLDGVYVFESYYLADVINNMVFDFIYHEHLSAFSVQPIKTLFEKHGLKLIAVEHVETKGGSLRYFVQRAKGHLVDDNSVTQYLEYENKIKLYDKETYVNFANKIDTLKENTIKCLKDIKKKGKTIAAFGASITCTTLIYHFEIGKYIEFLVDDNPSKQGRFSPGLHLPVYSSDTIYEKKPDYVLILAWRFSEQFINKHHGYLKSGGTFVIPIPEFKVIKND